MAYAAYLGSCSASKELVCQLPYSGLFSLGANFPEWARDSGKFMLGCL